MCLVIRGIYCLYGIWMDISCLNYIYMCNSSFAIPYIPKYFITLLKQCFPTRKHRNPTGKQRNPVGKSDFRFLWIFLNFEIEKFEISPENSFRVVPETEFFFRNLDFPVGNFFPGWTRSLGGSVHAMRPAASCAALASVESDTGEWTWATNRR